MALRKKVCEELIRERSQASFSVKEMTQLLDGSEQKTQRRKELEDMFFNDLELKDEVPWDYCSHSEVYENAIRKSLYIFNKSMELSDPREALTIAEAIMHEASPVSVHFVMFIPALMGHATEDQQTMWLGPALEMKILGTYAQTELGHGTFIRGLETTATYDPQTEEFIINTPTLSSVKWWPGGLGKTANHAIVVAQLYTKGKCYGIHPFMVQLRSMEDHQPIKGITVGEIGPKMGMRASDNGFLKLDNVRIPRTNMLMKNAQVTKDGVYVKPKSDKLNYGTMVFVRVILIDMVAINLARACTIAIRYSAVRRQSELIPGEKEAQILSYQAQQYKLFPLIALSHALKANFMALMDIYKNATQDLERGDLGMLPELHSLTSGLKALSTEIGSQAIESCRLACGGHGYLLISGLPRLYASTVAACTYEGENTVLYLQVARYLLKCLKGQQQLAPESMVRYLLDESFRSPFNKSSDVTDVDWLISLYRAVAYRQVHQAAERIKELMEKNRPEVAWNMSQVDLIKGAKAHIMYCVLSIYVQWIKEKQCSAALKTVLMRLCHVYLLWNILENPVPFGLVGMTDDDQKQMRNVIYSRLAELRPDAVALVDAFDFHDLVLNSALGCYDGQVYERMYEWAQNAPLNKSQVHESYYKHLQPFIKSKM
ncbi:peroxisomal acyl-coenzyme A oxidase 1-like [Limulus polyphemus]|uniref:Acyl-coenzyme A oxidase n=1 Tax=Limulus polyphemus TaxID=6850 RepID=A0ABM1BB59_LIMPO|nr:peroxisomal acyl-coenzyme A oxidase 1-like [Limulus polyphemus]